MHAHTDALRMAGGIQLVDGATGPSECFGGGERIRMCVCMCIGFVSLSPPLFLQTSLCLSDEAVGGEHQSAVVVACYSVSLSCR